jgi:hypothetical protein
MAAIHGDDRRLVSRDRVEGADAAILDADAAHRQIGAARGEVGRHLRPRRGRRERGEGDEASDACE